MNDYLSAFISACTILGIGWKGNEQLSKIRKELAQNTVTTVEAKNSTIDTTEDLKHTLDQQFIKLQKFNGSKYRELSLAQNEQQIQIALLLEKVKNLENQLDAITSSNKSEESSS